MSSFVSYNPCDDTITPPPLDDGHTLDNVPFWPSLDYEDFRTAERLRTDIPETRLGYALLAAATDINRQLATFVADQKQVGHDKHSDIPLKDWQLKKHYETLYKRAVYATAHADLLERYADYSATGDGVDTADTKQAAADDYRRIARWAVSEIEGHTHSTVELI